MRSAHYFLNQISNLSTGRRLLDVGCHTGFFLEQARQEGWVVQGTEPSKWAAWYARKKLGLSVFEGTIEDFPDEKGQFDVITLFHVLEHINNPKDVLKKAWSLLAKNGLVVIEVPNIQSLAARLLRSKWWMLKSTHLYYFSPKTLIAYLNAAGFNLIKQESSPKIFSLGHLAERLEPYNRFFSRQLLAVLKSLQMTHLGLRIDFTDLLLVYGRKQ